MLETQSVTISTKLTLDDVQTWEKKIESGISVENWKKSRFK